MPATTFTPRAPGGPPAPAPPSGGRQRPAARAADAWPRTNRLLPWLLAAFLAMLWLVPFDSTQLRADFPVDLKLDRLLLGAIVVVWLGSVFAGGRPTPRWRGGAVDVAVLVFAGVAVASVLLNLAALVNLGELTLATKKLALLLSYVTFFFIVATTVRPAELRAFLRLFMALAGLAAVGVLYDYFAHENLFFDWWAALVPESLVQVQPRAQLRAHEAYPVVGPTLHGLALAGMFAMALAFAAVATLQSATTRARVVNVALVCLYVAAVLATSRKTGAFASLAAVGALAVYRPRQTLRLVPVAAILVLAVLFVRPSAVEYQARQVDPVAITAGLSGAARQSDYDNITLDVREHLLTGRGYGSYDPDKYRILDNNYLVLLLETGLLGLAAMALLILAVVGVAHRTARSRHPVRAGPALIAVGGAAAFATEMALFDALAFAQVPYMFFFLAAVAVVCRLERFELPTAQAEGEAAATPALPSLARRLGRGRRRIARRRGGRRPVPPRVRRRQDEPDHAPPTRPGEPAHPPGRTRPAPGAPADAPGRRRRRVLPPGVRERAERMRRSAAGRGLAGVLTLGLVIAAFGRGGEAPPSVPGLGGSSEVAGSDPFATGAAAPARGSRPAQPPPAGPPAAAPGTTTLASAAAPGASGTPSPTPRPRPERRRPRPEPRRPRTPRPPAPAGPGPAAPPATVATNPREPDCLPGDAEAALVAAGLPRCPTEADIPLLEAAAAGGRLPAADLETLLAALRAPRA